MAKVVKWYIGTESLCDDLVAQTNLYYGYPNEREKTLTWAIPAQNPENESEWTIPFNQWMLDNLTVDPNKLVDAYPFEYPSGPTGATGANDNA